jgi:hypothetical protein
MIPAVPSTSVSLLHNARASRPISSAEPVLKRAKVHGNGGNGFLSAKARKATKRCKNKKRKNNANSGVGLDFVETSASKLRRKHARKTKNAADNQAPVQTSNDEEDAAFRPSCYPISQLP